MAQHTKFSTVFAIYAIQIIIISFRLIIFIMEHIGVLLRAGPRSALCFFESVHADLQTLVIPMPICQCDALDPHLEAAPEPRVELPVQERANPEPVLPNDNARTRRRAARRAARPYICGEGPNTRRYYVVTVGRRIGIFEDR